MAVVKKLTGSQRKSFELKADRNLLGRLLILSQTAEISLPKLFCHPLGPIPWALATADSNMVKSSKAQIMHHFGKSTGLAGTGSMACSDKPTVYTDSIIIIIINEFRLT